MQQQQQQHADYDLLAVFNDEAQAEAAAAKLHKEGFGEEEVHRLAEGTVGQGQFRQHGPNQARSEFFLQTQRSKPNPLVAVLFALIFAVILGGLAFVASLALPVLPEPVTLIIAALVGIVIGASLGAARSRRVRGAIGQETPKANAPPAPKGGAKTVVALRFADPDNISRKSRARAILINNQGKIDRSVGRRE